MNTGRIKFHFRPESRLASYLGASRTIQIAVQFDFSASDWSIPNASDKVYEPDYDSVSKQILIYPSKDHQHSTTAFCCMRWMLIVSTK